MKVLVTGGGGFLGSHIVKELVARGDEVVTLNRNHYVSLEHPNIKQHQGCISDIDQVIAAANGCNAIIHTAAKAGVWGPFEEYHQANVIGTRNIITACRRLDIPKLVYTSSPSVVFDGIDQEGVDETAPIPTNFQAFYPQTKAAAEQLVLKAKSEKLAVVALRPHLIWGPGDNHLAPRIIARAHRLRLIGGGRKKIDAVYIDNAVKAHLLALDNLSQDAPCNGKAYFVTNHEPWPMADMINGILKAANIPTISKSIPYRFAYSLSDKIEILYRLFRIKKEPPLTRFMVLQLGTAHWFNNQAAIRDLGYQPEITMAQGFTKLAQSFSENL